MVSRTKRKKVTDALVNKLKEINGIHPFNSNVFDNVSGRMKFLDEIKKYVREVLFGDESVQEHDALLLKPEDWKKQSKNLRSHMATLLKHIEDDQYKEGLESIDTVIGLLRFWKLKIGNYIYD